MAPGANRIATDHRDAPKALRIVFQIGKLMAHNEVTAKKYYDCSKKAKESVEASKALGKMMRNQGQSDTDTNGGGSETHHNINGSEGSDGKKREAWTESETAKLQEHFSTELQNKEVTLNGVRKKLRNVDNFRECPPGKCTTR